MQPSEKFLRVVRPTLKERPRSVERVAAVRVGVVQSAIVPATPPCGNCGKADKVDARCSPPLEEHIRGTTEARALSGPSLESHVRRQLARHGYRPCPGELRRYRETQRAAEEAFRASEAALARDAKEEARDGAGNKLTRSEDN